MRNVYHAYRQTLQRKHSLEVKQYKLENHIKEHPTDYTSVIANELLKSDIYREEDKLVELKKKMSIYEDVQFAN